MTETNETNKDFRQNKAFQMMSYNLDLFICLVIHYMYATKIKAGTSGNVLSDICAQRRFRSACAFAQADQNLLWANFG